MRSLKPKPSTLSRNQSKIWDAMNGCSHTKLVVSNRSGICLSTLDNWLMGKNEPGLYLTQQTQLLGHVMVIPLAKSHIE